MLRMPLLLAGIVLFALPLVVDARGGSSHGGHASANHSQSSGTHHSRKATGVERDSRGRIKRSAEAKHDFQKSNPCPSTGRTLGACPGYVIDHVTPLKRGGA